MPIQKVPYTKFKIVVPRRRGRYNLHETHDTQQKLKCDVLNFVFDITRSPNSKSWHLRPGKAQAFHEIDTLYKTNICVSASLK